MKYQKIIMEKHYHFAWENRSGLVLGLDTAQKAGCHECEGRKGSLMGPWTFTCTYNTYA